MSVIATDDFNRANETPMAGNWTQIEAHEWNLTSNVATPAFVSLDTASYWNATTFPNDQYSQAKITVTGTGGGGAGLGLGVRMSGTVGNATYYRLVIDHASSNNIELSRIVGGAFTQLWLRTQAFTNGDTLRLEVSGSTLTAKLNGTAIGTTYTDASPIASGRAGIAFSSSETAATLDDWEGGDLAAVTPTGHNFMTLLGVT